MFQYEEVYIAVSTVLGTENIIFNEVFLERIELSNLLNKRNHSRGQFPALRTKEKIGISVVNDDNLQQISQGLMNQKQEINLHCKYE